MLYCGRSREIQMSEMVERKPGDPMGEMAKRAQLALIQKFGAAGTWDRFMLGEMARTVIAEMREPTEEMRSAGEAQFMCRSEDVWEIWRAMIDAELGN